MEIGEKIDVLSLYPFLTIIDLINDAEKAIKNDSPLSALALTFACISECANIEYPDAWFKQNANTDKYLKSHFPNYYKSGKYDFKHHSNHDKERFVMWVDDWENTHNCEDDIRSSREHYQATVTKARQTDNGVMPWLDGDILYQMRCSLLHEGSNNIDSTNERKIKDVANQKIKYFIFNFDAQNKNIPFSSTLPPDNFGISLQVNIYGIVDLYISRIRSYLEKHQDKIKQFKIIRGFELKDF